MKKPPMFQLGPREFDSGNELKPNRRPKDLAWAVAIGLLFWGLVVLLCK